MVDRAGMAVLRFPRRIQDCPNMSPIRRAEREADEIKAAGACNTAVRRLIPPRLLGKEAFSQDQSVRGLPMIDSRVSLMALSKAAVA